jgi:hypothetical protein
MRIPSALKSILTPGSGCKCHPLRKNRVCVVHSRVLVVPTSIGVCWATHEVAGAMRFAAASAGAPLAASEETPGRIHDLVYVIAAYIQMSHETHRIGDRNSDVLLAQRIRESR